MASTSSTPALGHFRPASMSLATIGLSLGTFMQVLDMSIANVSLPTIAGNLAVSQDESTWVITSFTVCQAITLPMTGFLSRRFGETNVFVCCALAFSLFSLFCGLSTSLGMLVMFRAFQGAVCGPMYPITQSLMVEIYPRDRRGMALAIIAMITVVAPVVGPVLGGYITDSYSWRWIFFINVPLGIFAAIAVFSQLHNRPEQRLQQRIDWVGMGALIIGVGALQILLDKGKDLDWFQSSTIIVLGVIATIALAVWVIWELTEDEPLVDLRLFRHRNFATGTIVLVLAFALFFTIPLLVPLYLQGLLGYTAYLSGLATAPVGLIPLVLTFWVGRYATKMDLRILTAASFVVMAIVCFMFGNFTTQVDFYTIAATEFLLGLGIALFFMPILTILLSDLEGTEIAEGSGSATFLRTLGASFAISIVTYFWARGGAVAHSHLSQNINPYNPLLRDQLSGANGGSLQHFAAGINGVITQQSMQISFNHVFDALGVAFLILIGIVWMSKPPFVHGAGKDKAKGKSRPVLPASH